VNVNQIHKKHYIAVIGGSVAGSEAASLLALNGFKVVVFDMNRLPYGKIEDGLPNWHINLRNRQINEIDKKLDLPNVRYVPNTKIGDDIHFLDLVNNWGFSAIILANGAWQDRHLPIARINKFVDKELIYQNAFIHWFNHKHEDNYIENKYSIKNKNLVIGGGLSSLDVIKVIMIELVKKQLYEKKGIEIDVFTLEKNGIDKVLKELDLSLKDLHIEKAKLVYRRTARDMPLKSPRNNSKESIEAAKDVSKKILDRYQNKFLFEFIPLCTPVDFTEENEKLKSIIFQRTISKNGKIEPVEDSFFEIETDMLISSIGSIPEKIEGLPYDYSSLKMRYETDCHVFGFENVFAIGNAITGRGNIIESKKNGKQMTQLIIDNHLTEDAFEKWLINYNNQLKKEVHQQIHSIMDEISEYKIQPEKITQEICDRTHKIHEKMNYSNYLDWVTENTPVRLENTLEPNRLKI
tara:strand:- start:445 stop:1836 length:1392 start_codon:yes stop_codon:yes gene_type:complete